MSSFFSRIVRRSIGAVIRAGACLWPAHSRLFLIGDVPGWAISRELSELARIADRLGIKTPPPSWSHRSRNQCVFFGSHFKALRRPWPGKNHRIGLAYFHGLPGTPGEPEFDEDFDTFLQRLDRIHRIQVSHSQMENVMLAAGVPRDKLFRIPIGIAIDLFSMRTRASRLHARERFGLPRSAAIVGSFQKDGVGWDEGLEPKMIKGPDVLLKVLQRVAERNRDLFVVLCGPARGYVRKGLERLGIPYRAFHFRDYRMVAQLYHTLDVYLVASRQEGGPKAVLESMASGVPLVTTRVGQAMDLVDHRVNGWMVDVEDVEGLAHWTSHVFDDRATAASVVDRARQVAEAHAYARQDPLWTSFMRGFVEGVPRVLER